MKLKALVAAVTFAVAGVAQADINSDNVTNFGGNVFGPTGGVGELFISIVARNAADPSQNNSYVFDTGITADTFVDAWLGGTLGSLNGLTVDLSSDSNFNSFVADNSSPDFSISYNMLSVHNDENFNGTTFAAANAGFLTTSANELSAGDGPQNGQTGFGQASNNIGAYLQQVNNVMPGASDADNDSIRVDSSSAAYHDSGNWGNSNVFGLPTEGTFDNALSFYFLGFDGNDQTQSITPAFIGSWLLDSVTGQLSLTTTVVPIPAAVWLFGAGLVGLIGLGRRRSA